MKVFSKNINYLKLSVFLYFISSINSPIFIIKSFDIVEIFHFLRSLSPIIIFFFLLFIFLKKKITVSVNSKIFLLLILSQIIGFVLNEDRDYFDMYWIIAAVSLVLLIEYYCSNLDKTKELLGLVASTVLRCDDCIKYHLEACYNEGVSKEEVAETLSIGTLIGGTIVIPHLRKAYEYWEALEIQER